MLRFVAALLGVTAVGAAQAADLPIKAPPLIPVPFYYWTGFYVGGDIGGGWGNHDRSVVPPGFQNSYDSNGVIGGVHAGYNWQMQAFVIGVETDINASGVEGDDGGASGALDQTKLKWVGSLRGRVGYAWDRLLVYATGGWAYGELEHSNTFAGVKETFTSTKSGWTVGGGAEFAVAPHWLLRAEYRYYDLGTYQNLAPTNGVLPYEVANTFQTVTVGASYKF